MIILNLKMHMSLKEIIEYERVISHEDVIVLPQYPYLPFFNKGDYILGSQDVSRFKNGNYTGEVCAKALKDINVKYVLVGHQERREFFHEDILSIKEKLINVSINDMIPIFCLVQEKVDETFEELIYQIENIPAEVNDIVLAYEPTWMIGKNTPVDYDYLEKAIYIIKNYMNRINIKYKIVYGGNVNSENIKELMENLNLDGVIMSSAARDAEELKNILKIFK